MLKAGPLGILSYCSKKIMKLKHTNSKTGFFLVAVVVVVDRAGSAVVISVANQFGRRPCNVFCPCSKTFQS